MKSIETYHHTFAQSGAHTFKLEANPDYELLVKNLTSGNISVSYGSQIDTENDSYIYMLPETAEVITYKADNDNEDILVTVNAEGTGIVELRVLH